MDMRSIMEEVPLSPPSKNNDANNSFSSPGLRYRSPLAKSNIAISRGNIDDDDDTKSAAAIDNKQTIKCILNKKKLFGITSFIAVLIIIAAVAMSSNGSKEDRPAVNNNNGSSNNAVSIPSTEGAPTDKAESNNSADVVANMAEDVTNTTAVNNSPYISDIVDATDTDKKESLVQLSSSSSNAKSAKQGKDTTSGKASKKDGNKDTKSSKSKMDKPTPVTTPATNPPPSSTTTVSPPTTTVAPPSTTTPPPPPQSTSTSSTTVTSTESTSTALTTSTSETTTSSTTTTPPPLRKVWLSNLEPGQCEQSETSFNCNTEFEGFRWGYYLTCFENPDRFKYITGLRFWTDSTYGVGEGIGARISLYYYTKVPLNPPNSDQIPAGPLTRDPNTGGFLPIPYTIPFIGTQEVPATSDPQTTFKEGLNSVTFSGNNGNGLLALDPSTFEENNGLDGFCIGLSPAFRNPADLPDGPPDNSRAKCNFDPVFPPNNPGTYCPDDGLAIRTVGSGESSYFNCNEGFKDSVSQNPARVFAQNSNPPSPPFQDGLSYPGFCIEAEVSDEVADEAVKVTWNIQYGSAVNFKFGDAVENLYLDKYEPRVDPPELKPIAIFVHGGSCQHGSRKDSPYVEYATFFARNGFVAVSVSYRKASSLPSCRTPGSIDAAGSDIKAVIRYVRAKSAEWGADPTKIWLFGCSAGARAAAWATYVPGNGIVRTNENVDTSQNNENEDASVTALFMLSGELYVPHLECDLYACVDGGDPRCIEANEFVINADRVPDPSLGNCNYAGDDRYDILDPGKNLCDPARSVGCDNVVSAGDTPLTMVHNNPDNLPGTFTPWQVALRLQALLESKEVPVTLTPNTDRPGHCSPRIPQDLLLASARTSLGIES